MEPVATELAVRPLVHNPPGTGRLRHSAAWAAGIVLAFLGGCVSLDPLIPGHDGPPTGQPACQLVATWSNQVVFTPDPTHNGDLTPGLAGRLYLFGPTLDYPVASDGAMVIDLFDEAHPNAANAALPLEEWRLDRDTLQRLLRRDAIGWGYTVFLPWGTYRPDITHVHLKLRFNPVNGTPLFANTASLTLVKDSANDSSPGSPVAAMSPGHAVENAANHPNTQNPSGS